MLETIGVESIEDLFAAIPAGLRTRSFYLPPGMSEFELSRSMAKLAGRDNRELSCFIGGGYYDHIIPSVVDHLAGRSEFYTAYTPYQPECSQGTLQALYEYQTAICRLTGMEVSNASLYDGATALAEAALMAMRVTSRERLVIDGCVSPIYKDVMKSYLINLPVEVEEVPPLGADMDREGILAALDDRTAAVITQNPNFFGSVEDLSDIAGIAHAKGALLVTSVYPISLGMVKSPGAMGVDIVTGDGQSLGNPLSFGGPSFGFITTMKKYIRNLPGRVVGETIDRQGRRGYVLTLQAREQHIKRHRATSNICSNQGLCALRGLLFLASLGKEGFAELARLNYDKAEYAKSLFAKIPGVTILNSGPTFNEFTLKLPKETDPVVEKLLTKKVASGVPLGDLYPDMTDCMTVTVTEKRTKAEIDAFAHKMEWQCK
jgi:glycine dehydrogenase subunit 1